MKLTLFILFQNIINSWDDCDEWMDWVGAHLVILFQNTINNWDDFVNFES